MRVGSMYHTGVSTQY